MSWKTAHRSFYYKGALEREDLDLKPQETAMLCIDVQPMAWLPGRTRPTWAFVNLLVTGIYTDQCVSSTVRSLADESVQSA